MKIGIVVGSVREVRLGIGVGKWVLGEARKRSDAEFELIDLKQFNVPVFSSATHPMMANKHYDDAAVQAWSDAIDPCDAYIFVTGEYNWGVPGAFKNAVDSLGGEWVKKAIGFVSYGASNGIKAVSNWRQVIGNFAMYGVRPAVGLSIFTDFENGQVKANDRLVNDLNGMLDELIPAAAAMNGLRG